MKTTCRSCHMEKTDLGADITICLRCDTSAQAGMQRVGPPNTPGTHNGWFTASFGDPK